MAQKMDIASRTMSRIIKQDLGLGAFKQQTGQHLTVALKENRKKSRHLLLYSKEYYKKSSLQMKKCLLWRKLSISEMIEFMHSHSRKSVNWCQGLNEVIILVWW